MCKAFRTLDQRSRGQEAPFGVDMAVLPWVELLCCRTGFGWRDLGCTPGSGLLARIRGGFYRDRCIVILSFIYVLLGLLEARLSFDGSA
eukprot:3005766-Amphidinium_carterae.3